MQRSYSAIFGLELSTWGKLFNTKAVISFRKEYEQEEDKKVPVYSNYSKESTSRSDDTEAATFIQDAKYEIMDEGQEKLLKNHSQNHIHTGYKVSSNKFLNTYQKIQQTTYPIRGNALDFRV